MSTSASSPEAVGPVDASSYAQAILNVLDDFGDEQQRLGDTQRAVLNILDDLGAEKARMEDTQRAVMNVLEDFNAERNELDRVNADLRTVIDERMRVEGSLLEKTSELLKAEARLSHQALHDPLTGLPNRLLLLDRLAAGLARLGRRPAFVAVIFLDLDRFKVVNDSLGHDVGDFVLSAVAERLLSAVRPHDTVARLGGDEFVVVCDDLASAAEADTLVLRIEAAMLPAIRAGATDIFVTASVGVAVTADGDSTPHDLLRNADTAMYRAKGCGRNRSQFFDEGLRNTALAHANMEASLRQAITGGGLVLEYQPVVRISDRCLVGVEALVRLQLPDGRLVPPGEFIHIAEASGLVVPMGNWVLTAACEQAARWWYNPDSPDAGNPSVAVNISARQAAQPDFARNIDSILKATGLPAAALMLELTESVLIEATPDTLSQLASVRDLGVELGIDDFGTGYSSLTYLRRLPVSFLKVDRAFVTGLADEPHDRAIVNAVVKLAQALGLRTIAEGVETPAQFAALADMGCELVQGYLLGRPVPATRTPPAPLPELAPVGAQARRNPSPARVLIVDDDRRLREVLRLTLQLDGGFETVAEAADGNEAIGLAQLHQPDLVVLDLRMPGMSGVEALPRILAAAPAARVVVLTGLERKGLDDPALAGIAGCFEKAADLGDVVAGLHQLVGTLQ